MEFLLKLGKKHAKDKILLIKTDGYEQLSYNNLFKIAKLLMVNEEKCYPFGLGAQYLINALIYLKTHSVDETLIKFKCNLGS